MNEESLRDLVNRSGEEQHARILSGAWWHSIDLGDGRVTPGNVDVVTFEFADR